MANTDPENIAAPGPPSRKQSSRQPPDPSAEEQVPRGKRIQREVIAWMWVILLFLLINGTLGQARVIPSGSMENTLLVGDHLIMSRIGYDAGIPFTRWHIPLWRGLKRQQLAIFMSPVSSSDLVKRVIGLPGDTIDIHDGSVFINGKRLEENYTTGPTYAYDLQVPFVVPKDCYFMMGDNRGNSYDSRFMGAIPRKNFIGTPVMIYMSVEASPDAWETGQLKERFFAYANALIHPSLVRWHRLFTTF
jgi:signal peptidase I